MAPRETPWGGGWGWSLEATNGFIGWLLEMREKMQLSRNPITMYDAKDIISGRCTTVVVHPCLELLDGVSLGEKMRYDRCSRES